tara:strand:+ start:374 stop:517 length:144 start_codon:yes stop_codon:yes gene_type:complete
MKNILSSLVVTLSLSSCTTTDAINIGAGIISGMTDTSGKPHKKKGKK